jgi:hypothetical protein
MGRTTGRSVSLLLALCCLAACAGGHRFYPDVPRAQDQVALVITVPHVPSASCSIEYLRNEGATEEMRLDSVHLLDLLPGQYIASIAYRAREINLLLQTRRTTGKLVALKMDLKPGSVYVIYPEIGKATHEVEVSQTKFNVGSWHPVLVSIKDYQESACSSGTGQGWFSDCPSTEELEAEAAAYFESKRPVMKYVPGPWVQTYNDTVTATGNNGYWTEKN